MVSRLDRAFISIRLHHKGVCRHLTLRFSLSSPILAQCRLTDDGIDHIFGCDTNRSCDDVRPHACDNRGSARRDVGRHVTAPHRRAGVAFVYMWTQC